MRFSSIVALVITTASLALGGCAADAEPGESTSADDVAHAGTATGLEGSAPVQAIPRNEAGQDLRITKANDDARVRIIEAYQTNEKDPRIVLSPPSFGHVHGKQSDTLTPAEIEAAAEAHNTGTQKP